MKNLLRLCLLFFTALIYGQPSTEVYLFDLITTDGKIALANLRNVSNNEGYDNQPSFYDDDTIIFSATRNGQTDIAQYDIKTAAISWLTDTPEGSEYSPLRIPESNTIAAVRLDTTGLQRLYEYNTTDGTSKLVLEDAKIGYHSWFASNVLVATILVDDSMNLITSHLSGPEQFKTAQKNVGRSLQKIPNSNLVSFISKADGLSTLMSIDPISLDAKELMLLPPETNDSCWLADGSILIPVGNSIYNLNTAVKTKQPVRIDLSNFKEIHAISRISVSPDGKKLALVTDDPPSKIVQKQVDSYNAADLDAFINCYAEAVVVRKFPKDTMYVGHEKMRKNYNGLTPETKNYTVEVVNRITMGNKVIDHEKVTGNGKVQMQVAIYEVIEGVISSMDFIFDDFTATNPESIINTQVAAYNTRSIDTFLDMYAKDIELVDFPAKTRSKGIAKIRKAHTNFLQSTPDLHCEIKNRIIIGNTVIDKKYITANGNNFSAVLIYQVLNGKINKVTFL